MNRTEGDLLFSAAKMFNWVEYSVFGSMLVLSLLVGVYYGWFKKQDTVAEYLLGGKKMGVFPVTMSMIASHVSGVTLLGVPAEIYSYGTQFCAIAPCVVLMYFIINYLYLPVFYHLQLNSLYEYLELRFSAETRYFASFVFALYLITFIPIVIYVPALAFNQVTGVSIYVITPVVTLICVFYTSFGGLKAVVWTDTLQSVFTLGSTVFIAVLGYLRIGSMSEVFRINDEGGRLEFFNMDPSLFVRMSFWTFSVGAVGNWIAGMAIHPGAVQRYIAVSTFKKAKAVTFWSCVGFVVINALVVFIGLLQYANYHGCDPVAIKVVQKSSQLLPYYVMDVAKDFPGLTGLFISGVLSAALSTMSAALNTVAGTLYEDFVMYFMKGKKLSEIKQNLAMKIIVVVLGALSIALVVVVERLGTIVQMAWSLIGVSFGTLAGLFTLGIFFPRANAKGAMIGSAASLVTMAGIGYGAQYYVAQGMIQYPGKATSIDNCPEGLIASLSFNASAMVDTYRGPGSPVVVDDSVALIFQVTFLYYTLFGMIIVLVVGLLVSYCTEPVPARCLDPKLFSPVVHSFLPQQHRTKPPTEEYILANTEPHPSEEKDLTNVL